MEGSSAPASPAKTVTREQLMKMLTAEKFKKRFLKQKCAECGIPCMKSYAAGGPLVAKNMVDAFWCADCGRLLCSKHRTQQLHTCEKANAALAKQRSLSAEEIQAQVAANKRAAEEQVQREKEAEAAAAVRKKEEAAEYFEMKRRREVLAGKANNVAQFIQGQARKEGREVELETAGAAARAAELGELWQRAMHLATVLSNECHTPTTPNALNAAAWDECWEVYQRAVELSRTVLTIEGQELQHVHSWDR